MKMARSSSRLAGDRPEIGEADGLQAVGTRPVEIGDALRLSGEVAYIGEPALPVAAVGGELAALVITEADEEGLIIAPRSVWFFGVKDNLNWAPSKHEDKTRMLD